MRLLAACDCCCIDFSGFTNHLCSALRSACWLQRIAHRSHTGLTRSRRRASRSACCGAQPAGMAAAGSGRWRPNAAAAAVSRSRLPASTAAALLMPGMGPACLAAAGSERPMPPTMTRALAWAPRTCAARRCFSTSSFPKFGKPVRTHWHPPRPPRRCPPPCDGGVPPPPRSRLC
eukprot:SAG25_NODE_379_length_8822_cov_7.896366_9_plen_175_part_00